MKLISEEKATTASVQRALKVCKHDSKRVITIQDFSEYCISDFKEGVSFAETELQNLAIDFSLWIDIYRFENIEYDMSTRDLFQRFISERNK